MAFIRYFLTMTLPAIPMAIIMFMTAPYTHGASIPIFLLLAGGLGFFAAWLTDHSKAWRWWLLGDD